MRPSRLLIVAAALGISVGACSSNNGDNSTGTGGTGAPATGGTSASGGAPGSGGTTSTGGTTATGGTTGTAGRAGGGGSTGGAGRSGTGGTAGHAGSTGGSGGNAATGGSGGTGSGGDLTTLAPGNPAVPSAGCGKATTVTNGKHTITSSGMQRSYIIDIPTGYDMNKPYRFFYASHWISARAEDVVNQNYYFLKPLATAANQPAIFLAPQALPGNPSGTWATGANDNTDHILFDDILAYVKANLCIDTTRVFATGFSFGGMMTYSLSVNHQKDIRAAVGIAPANYNIYVPPKTHLPIAWMQTTGMSDGTCPWVNSDAKMLGAKYIGIEHGTDNGCTVPATIPTWTTGPHVCVDFQGCTTGHPTKVCTFDGPHTNIAMDPGSKTNWIPEESWKFFTQF